MCGIAGFVDLRQSRRVEASVLTRMADSIRHRGPDGDGVWVAGDANVGFAHRRLSIVDLSPAGKQPMANDAGSVVVTFNGEIYNFLELRAELEQRGYRFRSRTDTEVLLYLYEEHGDAMIEKLDGDFAFGLWDQTRRRVLLARDRIGVKPLYHGIFDGIFLFSSEIKAILEHPSVTREVNEESLYHYLTYLTVPAPATLLAGVEKLAAGESLVVDFATATPTITKRRYWRPLPDQVVVDTANLDEQFEDLFRASVRKRLMSDVPVGVLFSGGVDSTLNAASFQESIAPKRVQTYNVGVTDVVSYDDESEWAATMAAKLGTEHHRVTIGSADLVNSVELLTRHNDEPIADPVCVPLHFVTRLAKEDGTTVLHAGEGADETFCGYANYRKFMREDERVWRRLERVPAPVNRLAFEVVRRWAPVPQRKHADIFRRASLGQEFFLSGAVAFYEHQKHEILAPDFRQRHAGIDSFDAVSPLYAEIERSCPDATFLQKMTFVELSLRLPELLLMRVDKMSMANAVEVRVPFLDRDVVDFALSAPESFKLRDGVSKEPVKRLAARYVGREPIYRRKAGFGAPIKEWFGSRLGEHMRELLDEHERDLARYFDIARLRRALDVGPTSDNAAFQLWVVYGFIVWWRGVFHAA